MATAANRTAIDLETARVIARIRKLKKTHTGAEISKLVGKTEAYVSQVKNGVMHSRSNTVLDELGLRFSSKTCRRCGKVCGIVCKSVLCIVCELRELHKEGIIYIKPEE